MMKKILGNFALLVTAVIFLYGCKEERSDELVKKVVAENVKSFRNKKMQQCNQSIYDEASIVVDSLLINKARESILTRDSFGIPSRPNKPLKSHIKSPLDTVKVKPLFNNPPSK